MNQKRKIRWLLYHTPVELFIRTAEAFSQEVSRLTDGGIEIEILSLEDFAVSHKDGEEFSPIALMQSGDIEMSQLHVARIGQWFTPDFFALELPFLFSDHDHATRVLDGDIGKTMLGNLPKTTPMHGLAFTYSGGYRVFAANKPINTVADLQGLTTSSMPNPIMLDTAAAFGCQPTVVSNKELTTGERDIRVNNESIQTTLPRYRCEADLDVHKYVTNTQHSMYLTSIVISSKFWDSLNAAEREAMQTAASYSSKLERQWSIDDSDKIAADTAEQQKIGMSHYQEFPETERAKLKQMTQSLYDKYQPFFTPGLVNGILAS